MKGTLLACAAVSALVAAPAAAKEFRYYYGMQWVVAPAAGGPSTVAVKQGEMIAEASMLTEDLFETTEQIAVAGKVVLERNSQLATAVSQLSIRCTVARGAPGTLSSTRRICLTDDDRDGRFDHYFDTGLGQGGADVQFTGCVPTERIAIEPVKMESVAPSKLRDSMMFRVKLTKIYGKKSTLTDGSYQYSGSIGYEFGGSIGRNDRIWNYYSFCRPRSCVVPLGNIMHVEVEGITLRVLRQDGEKAIVQILSNLRKRNYWDMSRGNRPDPIYCPGTLFVKTDQETF